MSLPRLHLDYQAPARRPRVLGILLLTGALAVAGALAERHRDARLALERLQASQQLLAGERRPKARPKNLDEDLKAAEAVVRQLALPWGAMVQAVESAASRDVALLQMQPEARERQLRLTAEARNENAMLKYLRRLETARSLAGVHLSSHQVVLEDPRRPIRFTVLARLKEPGK
jgi:hypothetical protein